MPRTARAISPDEDLIDACIAGDLHGVIMALHHGANANANVGQPLLEAYHHGHVDIAVLLLENGANPVLLRGGNGYDRVESDQLDRLESEQRNRHALQTQAQRNTQRLLAEMPREAELQGPTCSDPELLDEHEISAYLREDPNHVVVHSGTQMTCSSRQQLENAIADWNFVSEHNGHVVVHPRPGSFQVSHTYAGGSDIFVPTRQIITLLRTGVREFRVTPSRETRLIRMHRREGASNYRDSPLFEVNALNATKKSRAPRSRSQDPDGDWRKMPYFRPRNSSKVVKIKRPSQRR